MLDSERPDIAGSRRAPLAGVPQALCRVMEMFEIEQHILWHIEGMPDRGVGRGHRPANPPGGPRFPLQWKAGTYATEGEARFVIVRYSVVVGRMVSAAPQAAGLQLSGAGDWKSSVLRRSQRVRARWNIERPSSYPLRQPAQNTPGFRNAETDGRRCHSSRRPRHQTQRRTNARNYVS